jgi:hypothetical protein
VQGRDAQWRPCRIDPTGLREVSTWVERYRVLWEGRLDRMEALLRELDTREPTG